MRGSLRFYPNVASTIGIIPAHAGLTDAADPCAATTWDHPRACGAHMYILHTWDKTRGSSPRMRGSLRFYPNVASTIGIIPAHAGLTLLQNPNVPNKRDHPRACGAHHIFAHLSATVVGSSPRMRGSLPSKYRLSRPEGIIPAHAGLTQRQGNPRAVSRDHPRACGAHITRHPLPLRRSGSSPRMRGSHRAKLNVRFYDGIIPAHAGLT